MHSREADADDCGYTRKHPSSISGSVTRQGFRLLISANEPLSPFQSDWEVHDDGAGFTCRSWRGLLDLSDHPNDRLNFVLLFADFPCHLRRPQHALHRNNPYMINNNFPPTSYTSTNPSHALCNTSSTQSHHPYPDLDFPNSTLPSTISRGLSKRTGCFSTNIEPGNQHITTAEYGANGTSGNGWSEKSERGAESECSEGSEDFRGCVADGGKVQLLFGLHVEGGKLDAWSEG